MWRPRGPPGVSLDEQAGGSDEILSNTVLFSGRDGGGGGGLTECLLCPRLSPSLSPCRASDPCADLGAALWVGSASRWGLDPLHGGYSPPWAGRWGDVLSELTPSRPRRTAVSPQTQFLGSHGSRPGVQAAPRDLEEGPGTRFALCLPVGALFSSPRGGRRGLRVCTARGAQAPLCSWGWGAVRAVPGAGLLRQRPHPGTGFLSGPKSPSRPCSVCLSPPPSAEGRPRAEGR